MYQLHIDSSKSQMNMGCVLHAVISTNVLTQLSYIWKSHLTLGKAWAMLGETSEEMLTNCTVSVQTLGSCPTIKLSDLPIFWQTANIWCLLNHQGPFESVLKLSFSNEENMTPHGVGEWKDRYFIDKRRHRLSHCFEESCPLMQPS